MATSHLRAVWQDGGPEQVGKAITVTLRGAPALLFQADGVTTVANPISTVLSDGAARIIAYVNAGGTYRLTGPDGAFKDVYVNDNAGPQQGVTPPPTVTGSRGANAALASLLTALASRGVIVDTTVV